MMDDSTKKELQQAFIAALREAKNNCDGLFVAMVIDRNDLLGGYLAKIKLSLVNNTDTHYPHISLLTGACTGDEDFFMETGKAVFGPYDLGPRSTVSMPESDVGELDFLVWYQFDITDKAGKTEQYITALPKYEYEPTGLPLLDIPGMRLDLDKRDGISIAEYVKTKGLKEKYIKYNGDGTETVS